MHVHHTSSRVVGPWQRHGRRESSEGARGCWGSHNPQHLTEAEGNALWIFLRVSTGLLQRNSPREIQNCGSHAGNSAHSLTWLWNGPLDRDGGSALPAFQDKQQTAYDIPNAFSSTYNLRWPGIYVSRCLSKDAQKDLKL